MDRRGRGAAWGRLGSMRAVVITQPGGPEVLSVQDIPEPAWGPEDLLVRVRATALNRADVIQRRGRYPAPGRQPAFDVPGLEFAGEVVGAGERVSGFAEGDRVMGLLAGGGYSEVIATHHRLVVKVPDNLSWEEAGSIPEVFITAHDALLQCDLVAGERVLIHAAGSGVGIAGIQIAKAMGASMVISTAGSDEKLNAAAALGLDVGINYKTQDFADEVLRVTDGAGVDVVLDVIAAEYWDRNMKSLATKGRMIIVGSLSGTKVEVNLGVLGQKRLQVRGTGLRVRPTEEKGAATRAFEKSVLPHLASGRIRTVIDRVYTFEQAAEAHAYMESNANFGKIVLVP